MILRDLKVKKYLDEIRDDVLDAFGLSDKYCKNCKNWTPEEKEGSFYGRCGFEKHCLMHRNESSNKSEGRRHEKNTL